MLEKATELTSPVCTLMVAISVFVSIFQNLIVLSVDPLTKIVPLSLKIMEFIPSVCPESVAISYLVSSVQSFIVLSLDPLAKTLFFIATEWILALCP